MKTFSKGVCLVLLAAWAGGGVSLAQTNLPPGTPANRTNATPSLTSRTGVSRTTTITNPPAPVTRVRTQRFSGKILTVDTNAQRVTLQGGEAAGIGVTATTKIMKDKKAATIAALAPGQSVSGMERRDATGKWQADTLNVGDTRQPSEEEPVVPMTLENKDNKATANIHILVPGGASEAECAFGNLPAQPGIVRTNTLSRVVAFGSAGADFNFTRSIRVDGGAVVAWYPNIADMDVICHVTPGKHEVTVVVRDVNSAQTATIGPITLNLQAGETQNADFR
jgi:hypothetical protein